MQFTKQQLIDAYCAATGCGSSASEIDAEIIRVQTENDTRLSILTIRKAEIVNAGMLRVNKVQARIDSIRPDAKETMKDVALAYLAQQSAIQSETDNDSVSL